jgi:hypothetical protein
MADLRSAEAALAERLRYSMSGTPLQQLNYLAYIGGRKEKRKKLVQLLFTFHPYTHAYTDNVEVTHVHPPRHS